MKHIKIILLLLISTVLPFSVCRGDAINDLEMRASLNASGPALPDSLMTISFYIQADNVSILQKINAHPDWWKYVKVYYQTIRMSTLADGYAPSEVQEVGKNWQIKVGLTYPLEESDDGIQEIYGGYLLSKRLVCDIPSYMRPSGMIFIVFAAFDSRGAAKTDPSIPSIYIPPMGVSILSIKDESALQVPHDHQNYIVDQFSAELMQGNFKKAEDWVQQYIKAGGDPVVAADFKVKIFFYQRKFPEAYEQYKKMAEMDAQYRKSRPNGEAYVLPGMVAEFKKKIDAAIERDKAAADKQKE